MENRDTQDYSFGRENGKNSLSRYQRGAFSCKQVSCLSSLLVIELIMPTIIEIIMSRGIELIMSRERSIELILSREIELKMSKGTDLIMSR